MDSELTGTHPSRWLPLVAVGGYGLWFALRSVWTGRGGRIPVYGFGPSGSVQRVSEAAFRAAFGGGLALVLIRFIAPSTERLLGPIGWFDSAVPDHFALVLLTLGVFFAAYSQAQMGGSWRIGVNTKNVGELVSHGLFRYSRNPVFLGMKIMFVALFLLIPSAFSATILAVAWLAMDVQVRIEEAVLAERLGDRYRSYAFGVPRWLGWPRVAGDSARGSYARWGWIATIAVFVTDQASKFSAVSLLTDPPRVIEVAPFFNLLFLVNRGVSFGLLPAQSTWGVTMLVLLTAVILMVVIAMMLRSRGKIETLALGAIAGGASGNLFDRLRQGGVTDFLDFYYAGWHWPAFNFADIAIVLGFGLLFIHSLGQRHSKTIDSERVSL